MSEADHHYLGYPEWPWLYHVLCDAFLRRLHLDALKEKQDMKKSIICLVSGIVAGIAMCLTAAYFLPESSFDDELGCF